MKHLSDVEERVLDILGDYTTRDAEVIEVAVELWYPVRKHPGHTQGVSNKVLNDTLVALSNLVTAGLVDVHTEHYSDGNTVTLYNLAASGAEE